MKKLILVLLINILAFASNHFYYDNGNKITVEKLDNYSNIDMYINSRNKKIGVNNTIIVKFLNIENINTIENRYNINLIKKFSLNTYVFDVNGNCVFEISALIYEEENVEFSTPNFIKQRRRR